MGHADERRQNSADAGWVLRPLVEAELLERAKGVSQKIVERVRELAGETGPPASDDQAAEFPPGV